MDDHPSTHAPRAGAARAGAPPDAETSDDDSLQVEINSLDELRGAPAPERTADESTSAPSHSPAPPSPRARSPLAARLTVPQRLARGGVAIAAVLLALALLLTITPNGWHAILTPSPPAPTPIPTPSGADLFFHDHVVPWGALVIDGRSVVMRPSAPSFPGAGDELPTFTLPRGAHQLRYDAPPFPPLTCRVSVPAAPDDTCPLVSAVTLQSFGSVPMPPLARVLDLGAVPTRLSPTDLAALERAAQDALHALPWTTAALLPGDHYRAPDGAIATAREPLTATLRLTLNGDPLFPVRAPEGGPCGELCVAPPADEARGAWLLAHVLERWRYAQAATGAVTIEDAPAAPYPSEEHFLLPLAIGWAVDRVAGWQVELAPPPPAVGGGDDPRCQVALTMFSFDLASSPAWAAYPSVSSFAPAARTAGCALGGRLERAGTPSPSPTPGPPFRLLYRCGVLLALDAPTQRLFPGWPLASPHEAAYGDQLLPS